MQGALIVRVAFWQMAEADVACLSSPCLAPLKANGSHRRIANNRNIPFIDEERVLPQRRASDIWLSVLTHPNERGDAAYAWRPKHQAKASMRGPSVMRAYFRGWFATVWFVTVSSTFCAAFWGRWTDLRFVREDAKMST